MSRKKVGPVQVRAAIDRGQFRSDDEDDLPQERVMRTLHGVGEPDDTALEFRGQDDDAARIRLEKLEKECRERVLEDRGLRCLRRRTHGPHIRT